MQVTIKDVIKNYKYYIVNTNKKYLVGKTSELMGYDMEEPQDTYELVELNHKTALLKSNDIDYDRDKDVVIHDSEGTLGECLDWIERHEPREMTFRELRKVCSCITKIYIDDEEVINDLTVQFRRTLDDYIVLNVMPIAKVDSAGSRAIVDCRVCVYLTKED